MRHASPARRRAHVPSADGGRHSGLLRQLPYWLVLGGVAVGFAVMRGGGRNVSGGTLAVGGVLLAAALARLILPERRAGMLVARRRLMDVVALAALGGGLLLAGLVLPVQS